MNFQKCPGGTLEVNEPHFESGCVGESEGIEVINLEANRGLLRNVWGCLCSFHSPHLMVRNQVSYKLILTFFF